MPFRVLCVCLGNICRSPLAEAAIRHAATEAGVDLEVDSAGLGPWHAGRPPHPFSRQVGAEEGLEVGGRARQLMGPEDVAGWDLVVAMDRANLEGLQRLDPNAPARLLRSFDPDADHAEVPDPYGDDIDAYRQVLAMIRPAAEGLVAAIRAGRL